MTLGFAIALSVSLPIAAHAGTMAADTIYTSTINAFAASDGINITTNAYFSAGNSLTLSGANGYITTQSSITASAFFGDGSHLANVANLTGDNNFTGANIFASSLTVRSGGRQIILSTGPEISNILIDTNGAISFSPQLHNSSATIVPGYSTTNTAFGPCIPSSTITFTTSGGRVELVFTGNIELTSQITQVGTWVNFLQDGQYVRDLSSNKGFMVWTHLRSLSGNIQIQPIRISYLLDAPPSGSHSYCLTLLSLNGFPSALSGSGAGNIFYVKEIK